jgi:hypothetical protein
MNFLALVLGLLFAAAGAKAAPAVNQPRDPGHIDASARYLMVKPEALNGISKRLAGFPDTGGNFLLYGAGATVSPGMVRAQVAAWTGGLSAAQAGKSTRWDLNLGALTLEQKYPMGQYVLTAGSSFEMGEIHGALDDGSGINRVQAQLFGLGMNAGVRWPAETRLGFLLRAGYLWLGGVGLWHGPQEAVLGNAQFDLNGANVTGQIELSF